MACSNLLIIYIRVIINFIIFLVECSITFLVIKFIKSNESLLLNIIYYINNILSCCGQEFYS